MSETDKFVARGREFIKVRPDFVSVLNAAEARLQNVSGPSIPDDARDEIIQLGRPDVAYYLANHPRGTAALRAAQHRSQLLSDKNIQHMCSRVFVVKVA